MSWRRRFAVALGTVALCTLALGAVPAAAQHDQQAHDHGQMPEMSAQEKAAMEAWMKAGTPAEQHAQLAKMAGKWTMSVKSWPGPGAEPIVSEATATRRMVWDRYLEEEVEGEMMGMEFRGRGLTGYDNAAGKWWSTWVDNMSTGSMFAWGEVDESDHSVTFTSELADPVTGGTMPVRTVVRHTSPDEEVMEMYMGAGDQEFKSMEITYRRAGR
ncbi:MAG TPA: DUF1579 family protein [Thermoanaerobaculia bacterium]|nr:DUF1579 family protein [Thermoanaerobaculia bacterium]